MADLPDIERTALAIIERTNEFRQSQGLAPVARNLALEHAAKLFATYLAKSGRFAHEADGQRPADRARAAGYWHCTIAENLALNLDSRGFTVERLATEAVEGWKASPGHRKNMVMTHVTEIGVGIAQAPGRDPKYISVQLFGRPLHLATEFQIVNRSQKEVSYTHGGKSHAIEPGVVAKHKSCDPGRIRFERAGAWLGGDRMETEYDVSDQMRFVLRQGSDGKVRVELHK